MITNSNEVLQDGACMTNRRAKWREKVQARARKGRHNAGERTETVMTRHHDGDEVYFVFGSFFLITHKCHFKQPFSSSALIIAASCAQISANAVQAFCPPPQPPSSGFFIRHKYRNVQIFGLLINFSLEALRNRLSVYYRHAFRLQVTEIWKYVAFNNNNSPTPNHTNVECWDVSAPSTNPPPNKSFHLRCLWYKPRKYVGGFERFTDKNK